MTDLRPTTLRYLLESCAVHDTFDQAAPWQGEVGSWQCNLADQRLEAVSTTFHSSVDAARHDLEPLLRAWEASAFLSDQYDIHFRFESEADEPTAHSAKAGSIYRRQNAAYPPPDREFTSTATTDQLINEIERFEQGEITLPAAVKATLALLGHGLPGWPDSPEGIAAALNAEPEIVIRLDELAARADPDRAPKPPAYRGPEWQWMQEALRRVSLQAGRSTEGPAHTPLRSGDFRAQL